MIRSSAHPKTPPGDSAQKQLSLFRKFEHKLKFAVVGFVTMFIGLGVMWFCIDVQHLNPTLAYVIQMVVSVLTNYTLNAWWTFRKRGVPYWAGLVKFLGLKAFVTIPMNQIVFNVLSYFGTPYWLGWGVGVVLTVAVSWLGSNTYVFRDRTATTEVTASTAASQTEPTR